MTKINFTEKDSLNLGKWQHLWELTYGTNKTPPDPEFDIVASGISISKSRWYLKNR